MNRCIRVLQTRPLPLGYGTVWNYNKNERECLALRTSHVCSLTSKNYFVVPTFFYTTNKIQAKNAKSETKNAQGENETQECEQKAETAQEVKASAKPENENETRADKVLADENASLQEKVQAISDEASGEYVKAFNPDFDLFQTETAELRALSEVRSLYENTPLWMKAPNGRSDTKLSERQWLQVRTPQFKKWFGDWEAVAKKKAIEAIKPMQFSLAENGEERAIYDAYKNNADGWRKQVIDFAFKTLPEKSNSAIGEIQYSRQSLRNALAHGKGDLKLLTLPHVDKLIENGALFYTWKDENKNTFFNFAHPITYNNENYIARLVVKQDKNGNRFYDHEFSEVIKKDALPNGTSSVQKSAENLTHLSSKSILHNILSVNEKDVSKVIDENGEPLVVYHNTAEYFDTFDISKARQNADIPAFFFSTGKNDWQDMGDVLVQAFLDIKNLVEKPIVNMNGREIRDSLVEKNIDGTISADEDETKETEYAVFNPNQIKSATDNTGAFRKDDNSILFQTEADISAEFADVAKGENVAKKVEDALNALIGEAIDTHSPPLQIEVTKENKAHVKNTDVIITKQKLKRHQSALLALKKIINNAIVDTTRDGKVDTSHNTGKRTLKHKANVLEYVYFNSLAKINDEFFTVALTTERVKNQNENLLDLYNVYVKKETSRPRINNDLSGSSINKVSANSQNVKRKNENLLGDILFQTEEDLMRDARFWGSWQEFKEFYDTGILSKEEMSQVPSDADARWYETVWEKAKGIRPTLDETQAEKIEVRYGAEKGNANDMDAYFETMLENFLKRIAEIKNEKLIANPQDESEVQFNDALLAKQQFINTRLRHASIVLNAERVLRGKELTVRAKRTIMSLMLAPRFSKKL